MKNLSSRSALTGLSLLSLTVGLSLSVTSCSGDDGDTSSLPPEFAQQVVTQGAGPGQTSQQINPGSADQAEQPAVNMRTEGLGTPADASSAPPSGQARTEGLADPNAPIDNNTQAQNNASVVLPPTSGFGEADMTGGGESTDRYRKASVTRDGRNYFFMANGWGPGFDSQTVSWSGTSFTVDQMAGAQGGNYEPASYPTVFCGQYSDSVSGECGLPRELSSLSSLRTGWSWRANGNSGEYNAAYDIWLGTGPSINDFSGFLMVWYREPVGQQPAGQFRKGNVTVENVPGVWDIWEGTVRVGNQDHPIINWVRSEGQDTEEMEFDIMDFVRDASNHGYTVPGTHVLSVAVGFEIWNGPVNNLQSLDFYVEPN